MNEAWNEVTKYKEMVWKKRYKKAEVLFNAFFVLLSVGKVCLRLIKVPEAHSSDWRSQVQLRMIQSGII